MKKLVMGGLLVTSLLFGGTAYSYDDRGGDNGNGNDQRRCHNSEGDCRGSFSPGPFDRSPVDIHDNQVCISPNCSSNPPKKTDPQPSSQASQF